MMRDILYVAMGSALGGVMRLLTGRWIQSILPAAFPWPTLTINILGSFAIGWIYAWAARQPSLPPGMVLMLTTGICGGFTTFSAFAYENITLLRSGAYPAALAYMAASMAACLTAVWVGILLGR